MVTKRKSIDETKRPWRGAGAALREVLHCPLCTTGDVKMVAYRTKTTRCECTTCGLRFSLAPLDVANTLRLRAGDVFEALPQKQKMGLGALAISLGANAPEQFEPIIKAYLQDVGTVIAAGALAKAADTPEERVRRLAQLRPSADAQPDV